jgi:predicted MarR family transcription regulator
MANINLTELEKKVLRAINDSDYGEELGEPIWRGTERFVNTPSITGKALSGVYSSLNQKGLVVSTEDGKDSTVYITDLGIEVCKENNLLGKFEND